MSYKIQIRSSLKIDLPELDVGEFGLCTDTKELFIGTQNGNIQIVSSEVIGFLSDLSTTNKSNLVEAINDLNTILGNQINININESDINGNININNTELIVYNDSKIIESLNNKIELSQLENKADLHHTHKFADIDDVDITELQEGFTLQYNSDTKKFASKPLPLKDLILKDIKDIRYPQNMPQEGSILSYNQGYWEPTSSPADHNNVSGSYLIELSRWGIKNDKSNPLDTVEGINNAFIWAYENGYRSIVLPKGEYLIPPSKSILPQNNTHYDFSGSKIYMEPNNQERYSMLSIGSADSTKKAHHITITNGEFIGDRYEHDFSSGGTHEWGHCISLKGHCKFITITNCILRDAIGDGYIGEGNYDVWLYPNESNLELGTINKSSGLKEISLTKIRTISPYDVSHVRVTNNDNKFMLTGNGYGSLRGIETDIFDLFFYDTNGNFIQHQENKTWYEDIERPYGAKTMHIVLHQESITNIAFEVRAEPRPEFITIENCEIMNNRRVGIVGAGTRFFYIRNNSIHHNTGYVGAGVDIEDGYRTNQNIFIHGNRFYGHSINDVILVGTYYVSVANNTFQANCGGSGKYWVIKGNHFLKSGGSILASDVVFISNVCHGSSISFGSNNRGKNIIITSCTFYNSSVIMYQSEPYAIGINSCSFHNDTNKFRNGSISSYNNACIIKNITIIGKEMYGATIIATDDSIVENSVFVNPVFSGSYFFRFKKCIIKHPSLITTVVSKVGKELLFEECDLTLIEKFITFNSPNSRLKFYNSNITHMGSSLDFISVTAAGSIEILYSKFYAPNATTGAFFTSSGFNRAYCIFKENYFEGNSTTLRAINFDWKLPTEPVIYINNTFKNIAKPIQMIGDTHLIGTSIYRPQRKLEIGMQYFDTTLGKPIYLKIVGDGLYSNVPTERNKYYKIGQLVLENGKVHECTVEGTTSIIKPTFSSIIGNVTIDGDVTWVCKGNPAAWADANGNII